MWPIFGMNVKSSTDFQLNLKILFPLFLSKKLIDFYFPITQFLKKHLSYKSFGRFSNKIYYKNPYP
jgi:hypothetical protein